MFVCNISLLMFFLGLFYSKKGIYDYRCCVHVVSPSIGENITRTTTCLLACGGYHGSFKLY